jgi:hypothetical protein
MKFIDFARKYILRKGDLKEAKIGHINYALGIAEAGCFKDKELKVIYLEGNGFLTDSSYGYIEHGLDFNKIKIVNSYGYVDYTYFTTVLKGLHIASASMYAHYIDDTYFYWFWTSSGSGLNWRVVIKYYEI